MEEPSPRATALTVVFARGRACRFQRPAHCPRDVVCANALPPCPDTPSCERTSREYDGSPDSLYAAAQKALESLGPTRLRLRTEERRAEAVYRVALVFKDDVDVAVRPPDDSGSTLFIRSASRVGCTDLGVNRRRVERFFDALHRALDTQ